MSVRGFRNALASLVPRWLSNRPGLNTGYKILWVVAQQLDMMVEVGILEAIRSWLPGYPFDPTQTIDPTTALPFIGRSRGILRGETESTTAYAARLRAWLTTWEGAGSSEVLVAQIQAYLGNTPTVRVVDRAGNWVSIAPNGTITVIPAGSAAWAWNWDKTSNPDRNVVGAPWWGDLWIVVTPCEWPVTAGTTGGGGLAAIWGGTVDVGIGHAVPAVAVGAIKSLVALWKGAHTWVEAIIWNYDATLFDPTVVNAGNPNGLCGEWGWDLFDGNGVQPRRPASARYWIPVGG